MKALFQTAASTPYDDSSTLLGATSVQGAIAILAGIGGGSGALKYKGAWDNLTNYFVNDEVLHLGVVYICIANNHSGQPDQHPELWTPNFDAMAVQHDLLPLGSFSLGSQTHPWIQLILADGSLGAPALRFATDNDTGFWQNGDGNISVSANGVLNFEFNQNYAESMHRLKAPIVETGQVGTAAPLNLDLQADSVTKLQVLAGKQSLYSYIPFVPADSEYLTMWDFNTDAQPTASTTGSGIVGGSFNLTWGNGTSYDTDGNVITLATRLQHDGDGSISNYASVINSEGYFSTSGGYIGQFKGISMNSGVNAGYEFGSYYGIISTMNSTGGIFGGLSMLSGGVGLTDAQSGNVTGASVNAYIDGASVLSQGIQGYNFALTAAGTTTVAQNIQGVTGGISINDTAQANGGVIGYNVNVQVNNDATSNHINGAEIDVSLNQNAHAQGVTMLQLNFQAHDNSIGDNSNGVNCGLNLDGSAHLDSFTGYNMGFQLSGSPTITNALYAYSGSFNITGSPTMNSVFGMSMPINVKDSSVVSGQMIGIFTSLFLENTATSNDIIGHDLTIHTNDTAAVANQIAGMKVGIQTNTPHDGNSLVGLEINMTGAAYSAAKLAAGAQVQGLTINGGAFQSQYDYTVPGGAFLANVNGLGGTMRVAAGDPISNALVFGNNFSMNVVFDDDWGPDFTGLRIGPVINGGVGGVQGAAGKTLDTLTMFLAGMPNQSGAGTIDQVICYRAAGVLPSGGGITVNNSYGFLAMGTLGTMVPSGNTWGFYDDTAGLGGNGAENFLGRLAIGTSSKKVASLDVALEIGGAKAILPGRMTTAQKGALTAIEGMVVYDTDLQKLQWYNGSAWVDASGGYTPPTEIQEELDAGIDAGNVYDSVNVTFKLSHTPSGAAALKLYLNGAIKYQGTDYTIAGDTVTMTTAPNPDQSLYAVYTY